MIRFFVTIRSIPYIYRRSFCSALNVKDIERKIAIFRKTNNLPEAITLFEYLVDNGQTPSCKTMSSLLHLCQIHQDNERANVILNAINGLGTEQDESLLTSKLNYFIAIGGDDERTWSTYESLIGNGHTLRLNVAMNLLALAVKSHEIKRILELLSLIRSSNYKLTSQVSQLIIDEAIKHGWIDVMEQLIHYYEYCKQVLRVDVADKLVEWLKKYWRLCEAIPVTINSGRCSHCGNEMAVNKLNDDEYTTLLENARATLRREVSSFENSRIEEQEYWQCERLLKSSGPFGAVIDGQNMCSQRYNPKLLMSLCKLMTNETKLPTLIVSRNHLAKKIMKWYKVGSIVTLDQLLKEQRIYRFFIQNRVADDYYFIYSSLASGPHTYFISNDSLGDHVSYLSSEMKHLYHKWQTSTQVNVELEKPKIPLLNRITFPRQHSIHLQKTQTHVHIPTSLTDWYCVCPSS